MTIKFHIESSVCFYEVNHVHTVANKSEESEAENPVAVPTALLSLNSLSPLTLCVFVTEKRFFHSFMHKFKGRRHSFCFVVHLKLWVIYRQYSVESDFFLVKYKLPVLFEMQPWPFKIVLFHFVPFCTLMEWAIKVKPSVKRLQFSRCMHFSSHDHNHSINLSSVKEKKTRVANKNGCKWYSYCW